MNQPKIIRPVEHHSYAKLDGVRVYPDSYIWLNFTPRASPETFHIEMTFTDDELIIHADKAFLSCIRLIAYDDDGNAPGMENVEVRS
jgi:hypothetical protein